MKKLKEQVIFARRVGPTDSRDSAPHSSAEGAGAPDENFKRDVADYVEGMHPEIGKLAAARAADWIIERIAVRDTL